MDFTLLGDPIRRILLARSKKESSRHRKNILYDQDKVLWPVAMCPFHSFPDQFNELDLGSMAKPSHVLGRSQHNAITGAPRLTGNQLLSVL